MIYLSIKEVRPAPRQPLSVLEQPGAQTAGKKGKTGANCVRTSRCRRMEKQNCQGREFGEAEESASLACESSARRMNMCQEGYIERENPNQVVHPGDGLCRKISLCGCPPRQRDGASHACRAGKKEQRKLSPSMVRKTRSRWPLTHWPLAFAE